MAPFTRNPRKFVLLAGDVTAVLLSNIFALMLRFDFDWAAVSVPHHRNFELLGADLLLTPIFFYAGGLYQGYWKYVGLDDLIRLAKAVGYRTVTMMVLFYAADFREVSRAVVIISPVFLLLLAGAIRLLPRFHSEIFSSRKRNAGRRALIVGAGDTGESLLRELRKAPHLDYHPVGLIDDDLEKLGLKIHGIPVVGNRQDLERLIEDLGVREIILAIPTASRQDMREVFEICRRAGASLRTVPTRGELERGAARVSQIRPVDLEDLLGRDVVNLDQKVLRQSLNGKRVLVTGAAGSIGREMARQIAVYEVEELTLVDRNENNLFYVEAELKQAHPAMNLRVIVADILDRRRVGEIFATTRPHVVFHAAAYKHVPLMEQNPVEAIKNNVIATRLLTENAASCGAERFVYVSTDKAVRPTSVMGATKRLGERVVKSVSLGATRFIAVRFGNVLGSDGSVIPTFRKQIAAGGPVTVTHPEVTRYFMTIPEAVQLVLMAGAMGEGGETFLLRMGEPVRILDLARNMIELSGFKPNEDIRIIFTGLRPGEKLHEELKNDAEEALPTSNEKIMVLTGVEPLNEEGWREFKSLEDAAFEGRVDGALMKLRLLVPDYQPMTGAETRPDAAPAKIVGIGIKRRVDAHA